MQSLLQIINRFSDGSYKLILERSYQQIEVASFLFLLIFLASVFWNYKFSNESIPALMASVFYCSGIIIIYLLTPNDLGWHLSTSISRTMLPVSGCIYVGSYFLLEKIEQNVDTQKKFIIIDAKNE